jgi:hypothetical protein
MVSIINSFYDIATNSLKPSRCTPTWQELSEDTKSAAWSVMVWEISARRKKQKQKQNKTRGVSRCGLAIYFKKDLKAKKELWKLKYFTMQK